MLGFCRIFKIFLNNDYKVNFLNAVKFTESKNFSLDSKTITSLDNTNLMELIKEISELIPKELNTFGDGNQAIINFGNNCGNVHFPIVSYIKEYHPNIMVNLTMGSVLADNEIGFDFNERVFCNWITGDKPKILDCHTWITINNNIILDFTIGTYLNTREVKNVLKETSCHAYGGVIYGNPSNLKHCKLPMKPSMLPEKLSQLKYRPVVLGKLAFSAASPRYA